MAGIVCAAIAVAYRTMAGDNVVAFIFCVFAIALGAAALLLRFAEKRRAGYSNFPPARGAARNARLDNLARWGAVIAIGSFVWLLFAVTILKATNANMTYFYIWLTLFVFGSVLVFLPTAARAISRLQALMSKER